MPDGQSRQRIVIASVPRCFFLYIHGNNIEDCALPRARIASASHNVTNNIPHEKPEQWSPYLVHKLKYR